MARVVAGPLTDPACAMAGDGWLLNKGSSWWDGNYQNALYNHYLTPNAGRPDCIVYHNPGWKACAEFSPRRRELALLRRPRRLRQGHGESGHLASPLHPRRWRGRVRRLVLTEVVGKLEERIGIEDRIRSLSRPSVTSAPTLAITTS